MPCQSRTVISWSDTNPGMRFLKCATRVVGCDFWYWVDKPHEEFLRQLLVDLREAIKGLRQEKTELQQRVQAQQMTISVLQAELEDARREKSVLQLELQDADRRNVGVEGVFSDTARGLGRTEWDGSAYGSPRRVEKLEKGRSILWGAVACCVVFILAFFCCCVGCKLCCSSSNA
ncbi:hypothetical protein BS78_04G128500 [Paspalum vaginatum]|nr:hypothetical protein BS78_04G128500 [Paspalum vaginatum]